MKITIKQLKQLIKEQVEAITPSDKEENITDIIEKLFSIPGAARWVNKDAQYDDVYVDDMPLELFTRLTGLTEEDIERIDSKIEDYEGSISVHKSVTISGGA